MTPLLGLGRFRYRTISSLKGLTGIGLGIPHAPSTIALRHLSRFSMPVWQIVLQAGEHGDRGQNPISPRHAKWHRRRWPHCGHILATNLVAQEGILLGVSLMADLCERIAMPPTLYLRIGVKRQHLRRAGSSRVARQPCRDDGAAAQATWRHPHVLSGLQCYTQLGVLSRKQDNPEWSSGVRLAAFLVADDAACGPRVLHRPCSPGLQSTSLREDIPSQKP